MPFGFLARRAAPALPATADRSGFGISVCDCGRSGMAGVRVLFDPKGDSLPRLFRTYYGPIWERWETPQSDADHALAEVCGRELSVGRVATLPLACTGLPRLFVADVAVPLGEWVAPFMDWSLDHQTIALRVGPGPTVAAAAHIPAEVAARRRVAAVSGGLPVTARLVQANHELYRPGDRDRAALVLVSFDPAVRPERLEELAAGVYQLKLTDPTHPAAAGPGASDQRWEYHRRFRLPDSVTGGPAVYACDLWVPRACLPGGVIGDRWLRCVAEPGDAGGIELLPPD